MEDIKVLSELTPGERGKVKKITGEGQLKRKLLDMGVIPGSEIEVIKVAPLGDPINIKIKGYQLSLRKEEARQISIKA